MYIEIQKLFLKRYVLPALAAHYLTFILGLLFMLCYYLWFHPTGVQIIIR